MKPLPICLLVATLPFATSSACAQTAAFKVPAKARSYDYLCRFPGTPQSA